MVGRGGGWLTEISPGVRGGLGLLQVIDCYTCSRMGLVHIAKIV